MSTPNNPVEHNADREIVITRMVSAPRELVWEAWTNPKHVVNWWGPKGFTTTIEEMEVRVGGKWKHVMHGPDGTDYPNKSVFTEVVKPERIVYAHAGGKQGGPGVQFVSSWTFEKQGDKTVVTIRMVFAAAADRDRVVKEFGAIEGGKQTLGRLDEYLPKVTTVEEFVISRVFDAPRELVWKAFSDPEHMKQWWGPKGFTVVAAKMDFRAGGSYHYGIKSPEGQAMWGKFVYREITPPARMVFINFFSDENGGLSRHPMNPAWPQQLLSVFTFEEQGGKTKFTIRWSPYQATEEERKTFDEGRKSMTMGWTGTLDQLAGYLVKAQLK